jgi:hypothetical protein
MPIARAVSMMVEQAFAQMPEAARNQMQRVLETGILKEDGDGIATQKPGL